MKPRSLFRPKAKTKPKIEAKTDEATLYLYDEIGYFGVEAEPFIKDLNSQTAKTIHLRINSPGGDVFDGAAIYNAFRQHKSKIVTHIDGLAASYASVIAMAGDEVRISKNAFLMIHNPWSIAIGDADDMRATADLLDKMQGTIAEMYADKTGKEIDEIKEIMTAETWYTAQEALEAGFVDKIEDLDEKTEAKAKILFDLSVFNNVPDALIENRQSPTEKEMERALRDVGCSIKQAKAILADGYQKEAPRDVETSIETPQASVETPRDVGKPAPRDVEQPKQVKDRARALLIKAEQVAPHKA